jgi:hypothetical protein
MAARTPDVVTRAGATPTVISPPTNGDTFPAGPSTYLRLTTTGTVVTVTITPPAAGGPLGLSVSAYTFTMPATGTREIGPFPAYPFADQNGNVTMTFSVTTGLSLEVKNYAG